MNMSNAETPVAYSVTTTSNRSLSPAGRLLFLVLIGANTLIIALISAWAGAWPVVPFAGIELAALALAFHIVSLRDNDYERLTLDDCVVRFESSHYGKIERFEFNSHWAQLVCRRARLGRCEIALRSHGKEVDIGRLMSDEQRLELARELSSRIRTVNS